MSIPSTCQVCGVPLDDETRPCSVCDVCPDHMPGWDCAECRDLRAEDSAERLAHARGEAS